jgi:hypothetical protein
MPEYSHKVSKKFALRPVKIGGMQAFAVLLHIYLMCKGQHKFGVMS